MVFRTFPYQSWKPMKRASTINTSIDPSGLPPEFISWLESEKANSRRRLGIVRISLAVLLVTALVVIMKQPDWLHDIFGFIHIGSSRWSSTANNFCKKGLVPLSCGEGKELGNKFLPTCWLRTGRSFFVVPGKKGRSEASLFPPFRNCLELAAREKKNGSLAQRAKFKQLLSSYKKLKPAKDFYPLGNYLHLQ